MTEVFGRLQSTIKQKHSLGAQRGHVGKTLKMAEHADAVASVPLTGHRACGQAWDSVNVHDQVARQVMDLPELRLQVTEYRAGVKVYPRCPYREHAAFPDHVPGRVQYGLRVHGLAVYLNTAHFVPLERTTEILEDLCGARPSGGIVALNLQLAANRLVNFKTQLKATLLEQSILHADETNSVLARTDPQQGLGRKVNRKLQWPYMVNCAEGHERAPVVHGLLGTQRLGDILSASCTARAVWSSPPA